MKRYIKSILALATAALLGSSAWAATASFEGSLDLCVGDVYNYYENHGSQYTLSLASNSDSSVADGTVGGQTMTSGKFYTITAKKAGDTKIVFNFVKSGTTYTGTFNVHVSDKRVIAPNGTATVTCWGNDNEPGAASWSSTVEPNGLVTVTKGSESTSAATATFTAGSSETSGKVTFYNKSSAPSGSEYVFAVTVSGGGGGGGGGGADDGNIYLCVGDTVKMSHYRSSSQTWRSHVGSSTSSSDTTKSDSYIEIDKTSQSSTTSYDVTITAKAVGESTVRVYRNTSSVATYNVKVLAARTVNVGSTVYHYCNSAKTTANTWSAGTSTGVSVTLDPSTTAANSTKATLEGKAAGSTTVTVQDYKSDTASGARNCGATYTLKVLVKQPEEKESTATVSVADSSKEVQLAAGNAFSQSVAWDSEVTSDDDTIATAVMKDGATTTKQPTMVITPKRVGKATLTVKNSSGDNYDYTWKVSVTVTKATSAKFGDFTINFPNGADVKTVGSDLVLSFTESGTLEIPGNATARILAVGGGGAGGRPNATSVAGGGGGAGEMVDRSNVSLSLGTYTITVGAGGTVGNNGAVGGNGGLSSVYLGDTKVISVKGGGGGGCNTTAGAAGGSGGGGGGRSGSSGTCAAGTASKGESADGAANAGGQGNRYAAGGGGGAGGAGAASTGTGTRSGGAGGAGKSSTIADNAGVIYAAGGGGGAGRNGYTYTAGNGGSNNVGGKGADASNPAEEPKANTGSGGGGGAYAANKMEPSAGADGIVIVRISAMVSPTLKREVSGTGSADWTGYNWTMGTTGGQPWTDGRDAEITVSSGKPTLKVNTTVSAGKLTLKGSGALTITNAQDLVISELDTTELSGSVVFEFTSTGAQKTLSADWIRIIRAAKNNVTFRFSGSTEENGFHVDFGNDGVNEASLNMRPLTNHLVFASGDHKMTRGVGVQWANTSLFYFGVGATDDKPTLLVENGATLEVLNKNLTFAGEHNDGASGLADMHGVIRVNAGGTLNFTQPDTGNTFNYHQRLFLEPGSTTTFNFAGDRFQMWGGTNGYENGSNAQIYVPAGEGMAVLKKLGGDNFRIGQDTDMNMNGLAVFVGEGSKLQIDSSISAGAGGAKAIVKKFGAGELEITGACTAPVEMTAGIVTLPASAGAFNGGYTAAADVTYRFPKGWAADDPYTLGSGTVSGTAPAAKSATVYVGTDKYEGYTLVYDNAAKTVKYRLPKETEVRATTVELKATNTATAVTLETAFSKAFTWGIADAGDTTVATATVDSGSTATPTIRVTPVAEDDETTIKVKNTSGTDDYDFTWTVTVKVSRAPVDVPTAVTGLIYNGNEQTGVVATVGFTLTDNFATDAGEYTAEAKLDDGYCWADDSITNKFIKWSIAAKEVEVTACNTNMLVGCTVPQFKYEVTSGELVGEDELVGTLCTTDTLTVGTHDIVQGTLAIDDGNGGKNYNLNFVKGTLTVGAGKMTVNGKGYDNVTDAFNDLLKDKGSATFNDTKITYDGMTFRQGATLKVEDDESWAVTGDGGTSLIATKIPGKMNLTVDGTFELSGDIFVAPAGEDDTVVTVTNFLLDASITVGKESNGATDAMAYLSFNTFTNEDPANRITLTTNGVIRSEEQLTIKDVFAEVEHFEVVEKAITGGFEYTLEELPKTITITIETGDCVEDVLTNGVSVVGELELPAETTEVELTLAADLDLLTVPVFKVTTNDVTTVTKKTATYAIKDGDTLVFSAEEAEYTDPDVTEKQVKDAIIDAIDDENKEAVAPKIEAVVDTSDTPAEDKVSAKEMATWIAENDIKSSDMKGSDFLVASVKLDTDKPITSEDKDSFVINSATNGDDGVAITLELKGDEITEGVEGNSKVVVKGTNGTENVELELTETDGGLELKPKDEKVTAYIAQIDILSDDGKKVISTQKLGYFEKPAGEAAPVRQLLSVPWASLAPDGGNIALDDFIVTKSFAAETTKLYSFNKEKKNYDAWKLNDSKKWAPIKTVTMESGVLKESETDTEGTTIKRGAAVWLERADASEKVVFIGRAADEPVEPELEAGWNAVSQPGFDTVDLDTLYPTPAAGDKIIVPQEGGANPRTYTFKDGHWGYVVYSVNARGALVSTRKTDDNVIPAGCGYWYEKASK